MTREAGSGDIILLSIFEPSALSVMPDLKTATSFMLRFRARDNAYGVTRDTVKQLARHLDLSETDVVHIALSRLARQELPAYEADDGPLSARERAAVQRQALAKLPTSAVVVDQSLF